MNSDSDDSDLSEQQCERLTALRSATGLSDLVALTDANDEHEAYFGAKREWYDLRGAELDTSTANGGLAGNTVRVGDRSFHVHGITHADTDEERAYLRRHIERLLDDGAAVYCEQGIRSMYFQDFEGVCEMDDYRWAMAECSKLDQESHAVDILEPDFDGLTETIDTLTTRFREATFSLIDSGGDVYGDAFRTALGDIASSLMTSHEGMATGRDFEAFTLRQTVARNPERLVDIQHYYERRFLPQPVEREWLRRHDPELELVTHARNERMADYAMYHAESRDVHLIVGAAHQPGITYYLNQYSDGDRELGDFELVG